ncbi:MAG: hypothetical protein RPU52_06300 [Candidatus Sedimenticola sp. (ex Thyasira tokunagai)]
MTNYFIGWDVGGWNCDKNSRSRDAIVILDAHRQIVGTPWRGNLRVTINEAINARDWVGRLFNLGKADAPSGSYSVTIGIDTPLGFSAAFNDLATGLKSVPSIGESGTNPYLYRETERFLVRHGIKPLSAIKDMIGSQATKGMHALAKFSSESSGCGVWTNDKMLTAIEAYPSPCKRSTIVKALRDGYPPLKHGDEEDALTCALVAYLFSQRREELVMPMADVPKREGWIWIPKDVFDRWAELSRRDLCSRSE